MRHPGGRGTNTTDGDDHLTPYGDSRGLYVANRTPNGFEVREQQAGTTNVPFSYRVVARRKDMAGPRFEKVQRPERRSAADLQVPPEPRRHGVPERPDAPDRPGRP